MATPTLLTEIQDFCERTGLPVPSSIIGNPSEQIQQIKALLYEAGNSLSLRSDWERMRFETVLTTIAAENQGNIFNLTTGNSGATAFRKFADPVLWDRTDRLPVIPMDGATWQRIKGTVGSMVYRYRYRLWNYNLYITPAPPAGHSVAFEWVSRWWIQAENGAIQESFVTDQDSFLLERELLKLGLRWRWKKEKGLEYAEDFREYELRVQELAGHDTPKEVLYQDGRGRRVRPGVFVPEGSWQIP